MVEGWNERAVRLKNAPEKPERFKAKPKPKPNKKKSWRVGHRYNDVSFARDWWVQAYANERSARMAFESKRHETHFGPSEYQLINPAGEVVESYEKTKK